MTVENVLLKHFLAGLAYRTHKAVSGAPPGFATFQAAPGVRTPHQLIHHMSGVMSFALGHLVNCELRFESHDSFDQELERFHSILDQIGDILDSDPVFVDSSPKQLLQGPFADAMTHVGQIAMLRRLSGSPIPPENFHDADISADNLTRVQSSPVSPDEYWLDADGNPQGMSS
ncbi:MAG: hypothetical protein IH853_05015 [Bacteroidetes bacterium]|nr:hypothetical protein [Bacteroidota bacterium]